MAFTGLLHLVVWNGNLTTIERRLHNRQWLVGVPLQLPPLPPLRTCEPWPNAR